MVTIDGVEYRNLQEQVLQNQQDIQYLLNEGGVLNEFGIRVVGQVETAAELPDPATYAGEFGDAYAVGAEPPYTLYIWTRQISGQTGSFWFNIGVFPAPSTVPGPIGPQGIQGEQGTRGSLWQSQSGAPNSTEGVNEGDQFLNTTTGDVWQFANGEWQNTGSIQGPVGPEGPQGPQGIVGPQGPQGAQGPRGLQGEFLNILGTLENENQLPMPDTVARSSAYLIPDSTGTNHIWAIVGEGTTESPLQWQDIGSFGGGTNVIVDSESQTEVDLTNVPASGNGNFNLTLNASAGNNPGGMRFTGTTAANNVKGTAITGNATVILPLFPSDDIEYVPNNLGAIGLKPQLTNTYKQKVTEEIQEAGVQWVTITAPTTATNGQLDAEQLEVLQSANMSGIILNGEYFLKQDDQQAAGYMVYSHVGHANGATVPIIKQITITVSTRGWVLTIFNMPINKYKHDIKLYVGTPSAQNMVVLFSIILEAPDSITNYPDLITAISVIPKDTTLPTYSASGIHMQGSTVVPLVGISLNNRGDRIHIFYVYDNTLLNTATRDDYEFEVYDTITPL